MSKAQVCHRTMALTITKPCIGEKCSAWVPQDNTDSTNSNGCCAIVANVYSDR